LSDTSDPYAFVDETIRSWAKSNTQTLFTSFAGREARFFYVSSARGECLQVSIEPPNANEICINVSDVETLRDEEVHEKWTTPLGDLRESLDRALNYVRNWLNRGDQ